MAQRSSSLNSIDSGISREIGEQYANVKLVADNIAVIVTLSELDWEYILTELARLDLIDEAVVNITAMLAEAQQAVEDGQAILVTVQALRDAVAVDTGIAVTAASDSVAASASASSSVVTIQGLLVDVLAARDATLVYRDAAEGFSVTASTAAGTATTQAGIATAAASTATDAETAASGHATTTTTQAALAVAAAEAAGLSETATAESEDIAVAAAASATLDAASAREDKIQTAMYADVFINCEIYSRAGVETT